MLLLLLRLRFGVLLPLLPLLSLRPLSFLQDIRCLPLLLHLLVLLPQDPSWCTSPRA